MMMLPTPLNCPFLSLYAPQTQIDFLETEVSSLQERVAQLNLELGEHKENPSGYVKLIKF